MNPSSGKTPATTISFTIYGQRFQLLAAPEEHERIRRVAEAVDAQIQSQRERAASELRSILMAAYQIGYELDEIESQTRVLTETQQRLAKAEQTLQTASETTDRLIERIDRTLEETVSEPEPVPVSVPVETVETPEVPAEAEETPALEAESVEAPLPAPVEPEAGAISACAQEEEPVATSSALAAVEEDGAAEPETVAEVPSVVVPASEEPAAESVSTESLLVAGEPPSDETPIWGSAGVEAVESVSAEAPAVCFAEPVGVHLEVPEPEVPASIAEPEASVPEGEEEPAVQPLPEAVKEAVETIVGPESADQFVLDATPPEVEPPLAQAAAVVSEPVPETHPEIEAEVVETVEESAESLSARVSALFEAAPRVEPEAEKPIPETQPFVRPSVQDLWGVPRPAVSEPPVPEPGKPATVPPPEAFDASEEELAEMEMRLPDIEMELADVEFGIQVDEPFELDSEPESAMSEEPLFGLPGASNRLPSVEAGWPAVESFKLEEPAPAAPKMEPFDLRGSVPPTPPVTPAGGKPFEVKQPSPPAAQPYPQPQIRPNPLRAPQPAPTQKPSPGIGEKYPHLPPARSQNPAARTPESPRLFGSSGHDRHAVPPLARAQDTRVRPSGSPEFKTIGGKPWMAGPPSDQAKPFGTRNFLFGSPDKKTATPPIFHDIPEKKPRNVADDIQPSLFPYLDERLKKSDPKSNK